ncbi:MAG TPA: adenylyl-sulfate kinase [Nocardioidaceae bacterium]|nr:adenylyl-sulfate kinase [Nocardioidaceae bacterium]
MPSLPQHCPSPRELDDLELLSHGVLGLAGFEGPGGLVTLQVPAAVAAAAREADGLDLVDPEGTPLASMRVTDTYDAGELVGLTGQVTPLAHPEFGAFRRLYLSPTEVRERYGDKSLTVPVSDPLTGKDLDAIRDSADGRPVVLLTFAPSVVEVRGASRASKPPAPRPLSTPALIRTALAAASHLDDAHVVAVPLAPRDDAGKDRLLRERVVSAYASGEILEVANKGELPEAIAAIVARDRPGPADQGLVVFFTGLSGSGKSTLARALHDWILERGERTVTSLDGDVVRRHLSAGLGFSREDRETNIARIGWVAAEIARHRGVAICSPIAPFDATRKKVRAMVEDAGGRFVLVHVATPLEECERRDRKGLYAKARRGEIPDFTGISSPYEEPDDAAVRVDTTGRSIDDVLAEILPVVSRLAPLAPQPPDAPLAPQPPDAPLAPQPPEAPLAPQPPEAPLAPQPPEAPLAPQPPDSEDHP